MSQNHFTLNLPLKSSTDAAELRKRLPSLMPDFFRNLDAIGTIHYSRFAFLSEKELLFLGDIDGQPEDVFKNLARSAGSVFDLILPYVSGSPKLPVKENADEFVSKMLSFKVRALNLY